MSYRVNRLRRSLVPRPNPRPIRVKLGLSQAEFGQLLGVHVVSVSRWENHSMSIESGHAGRFVVALTAWAGRRHAKEVAAHGAYLRAMLANGDTLLALREMLKEVTRR